MGHIRERTPTKCSKAGTIQILNNTNRTPTNLTASKHIYSIYPSREINELAKSFLLAVLTC